MEGGCVHVYEEERLKQAGPREDEDGLGLQLQS